MKVAVLLLPLMFSGIQSNYIKHSNLSINETNINNVSAIPTTSLISSTTKIPKISKILPKTMVVNSTVYPTKAKYTDIINLIKDDMSLKEINVTYKVYHRKGNKQLQVCIVKSVVGKNLNIPERLQKDKQAQIAYEMSFIIDKGICNIGVHGYDSEINSNNIFTYNNIDKNNCDSSLKKTQCSYSDKCDRIVNCCDNYNDIIIRACRSYGIDKIIIPKCNREMKKCVAITKISIPVKTTLHNPTHRTSTQVSVPLDSSADPIASKIVLSIIATMCYFHQ